MFKRWESRALLWIVKFVTLSFVIGLPLRFLAPTILEKVSYYFFFLGFPGYPTLLSTAFMLVLLSGLYSRHRSALILYVVFFPAFVLVAYSTTLSVYFAVPNTQPANLSLTQLIPALLSGLFQCYLAWHARADYKVHVKGNFVKAALTLVLGILCSIAVTNFAVISAYDIPVEEAVPWSAAAATALNPEDIPYVTPFDDFYSIHLLGETLSLIALLLALFILMRSFKAPSPCPEEQLQVRRLLLSPPSNDSLGYFATSDNRLLHTCDCGRAGISYRVVAGTAIAAGDPLGPEQHWARAIESWGDFAHSKGWILGAASVSESGARAYHDAGMRIISLGAEAIINTENFDAKAIPQVRKALRAARKSGYTIEVARQASLTAEQQDEIRTAAIEWRNGEERGFTMASGRVADPRDRRTVVVCARDHEGTLQGLLTFVPWGTDGLSLDVMLRSPDAISGVNEAMVGTLAANGPSLGIRRFSLNFVMLRETFERGAAVNAHWPERIALKLLVFSSRWFQIQSLYQSNLKYNPDWQSRYFCVEHSINTARLLITFGSAEGFLPGSRKIFPRHGDPAVIADLESQLLTPQLPPRKLTPDQETRLQKISALHQLNKTAYPEAVPKTHTLEQLELHSPGGTEPISVSGRIRFLRNHGGVIFADLKEGHATIQLCFERKRCANFPQLRRILSRGDIISATGTLGTSHSGTTSLLVSSWTMAAKSLINPPFTPLQDPHQRAKQRHIDLAFNDRARQLVLARSAAITAVRQCLNAENFIEVETPILNTIHGGANARPFRTHIRAYNQHLTLRIAPELYLKRLVVGGIDRIYELGRNFRNEGVDATHNPEFTSLEVYETYGDWSTMRELTERIYRAAALAVHGSTRVPDGHGGFFNLDDPWPVVSVYDAVSHAVGRNISPDDSLERHADLCARYDVEAPTLGDLVNELYDALVEPTTTFPTFYVGFPIETSPLTMSDPQQPKIAQRWDLVAKGMELGTAYTELADPVEQRKRLTDQSLRAAKGDPEAMEIDEDFLSALEFGMPPTGGLGLGIDRMVMFLTGENIRETLTFPFIKPERA